MTTQALPPGVAIDDRDGTILADIQGNILRGYHMSYVRHLVVRVADPAAARGFIRAVVSGDDGVPQLTTAENWVGGIKPQTCLNVGVTATGLRALGLREDSLATFPNEFLEGAAARGVKVGDVDESAPRYWRDGLGDPNDVHLMWTIHAHELVDHVDAVASRIEAMWQQSGAFSVTSRLDGRTFDTYTLDKRDQDTVHFGYRDGISQPRFWVNGHPIGRRDSQPIAPVGAVLLGRIGDGGVGDRAAEHYRTTFPGVSWQMPEARQGSAVLQLGVNGCFNAFRVLEQDVDGFEHFLEASAVKINEELDQRRRDGEPAGTDVTVWDKERVAAKLMGRWRNGVPLSLSNWTKPGMPEPPFEGPGVPPAIDQRALNDFDYPDKIEELDDFDGVHCPMGAHIRRANPRSSRIVQRSANFTRRLVRRGVPYGPPYDPKNPRDDQRRGLLGSFMCASLIAQYEAVMYDWINLGLQDPRITGTDDPVIGANRPDSSRFEIPVENAAPIVLTKVPRFTKTVGAIYLFCPSLTALRFLADRTFPAT